jgi:hypothetical protein
MFNKFYTFVPSALNLDSTDENHHQTKPDAKREHLVREAQEAGMQEVTKVEVKICA